MTDAHTIARSLSQTQRRAVLLLDREWTFLGLHNRPDKTHPVIERWNRPFHGFLYRLTPLGQSVRAIIEEEGI